MYFAAPLRDAEIAATLPFSCIPKFPKSFIVIDSGNPINSPISVGVPRSFTMENTAFRKASAASFRSVYFVPAIVIANAGRLVFASIGKLLTCSLSVFKDSIVCSKSLFDCGYAATRSCIS